MPRHYKLETQFDLSASDELHEGYEDFRRDGSKPSMAAQDPKPQKPSTPNTVATTIIKKLTGAKAKSTKPAEIDRCYEMVSTEILDYKPTVIDRKFASKAVKEADAKAQVESNDDFEIIDEDEAEDYEIIDRVAGQEAPIGFSSALRKIREVVCV